ncbi:phosphotransferase enzyme family protein [Krasilnikoviella flava]|uniref:Homoserine kinase type II n=1 Tax=Krasilnikoviella flava TaxID=526729 RepID=A0A1T5LRM3_9MICO|nr:phosphotransferase [Krasilnikoviella flava]SKC78541.1 homoserine kinase type II [Krasilnikoviella flava]
MTPDDLAQAVPALIAHRPGVRVLGVRSTASGMNSVTVAVTLSIGRFVAKWVPASERDGLRSGAYAAQEMTAGGLRAGAPLELQDGEVTAPLADGEVALLEEVPGSPLTADDGNQEAWGAALGRAHRIAPRSEQGTFFGWVEEEGMNPARETWVRLAATRVLEEVRSAGGISWVQLHTDPAPEAFLRDNTSGEVGVIDWTGSVPGPALYDVASAVMYAGGPAKAARLLEAYLDTSRMPATEVTELLDTYRRFRALVQAVYFSIRLARSDLTGIVSQAENTAGLHDAREMLLDLGVLPKSTARCA